ncbi:hypothetical protein GCWU000325_00364 [Alloprevotella tannerae ATCC 51259]|uniref:Uncharacterized protein n=1 Tax=Alloprevotella tannerae ATCC 51259 TaxID=626522 RepID=C9LDU2_9BACT|nr:hypothetical protein GCWU000325_00364 [Alloprevotella tannerae ATCC 51259]
MLSLPPLLANLNIKFQTKKSFQNYLIPSHANSYQKEEIFLTIYFLS